MNRVLKKCTAPTLGADGLVEWIPTLVAVLSGLIHSLAKADLGLTMKP